MTLGPENPSGSDAAGSKLIIPYSWDTGCDIAGSPVIQDSSTKRETALGSSIGVDNEAMCFDSSLPEALPLDAQSQQSAYWTASQKSLEFGENFWRTLQLASDRDSVTIHAAVEGHRMEVLEADPIVDAGLIVGPVSPGSDGGRRKFKRARVVKEIKTVEVGNTGGPQGQDKRLQTEMAPLKDNVRRFVARIRGVQGHRDFSKWKGSVVDSIVGTYLTQNVSDHLSSSAYMNIAATWPVTGGPLPEQPLLRTSGCFPAPSTGQDGRGEPRPSTTSDAVGIAISEEERPEKPPHLSGLVGALTPGESTAAVGVPVPTQGSSLGGDASRVWEAKRMTRGEVGQNLARGERSVCDIEEIGGVMLMGGRKCWPEEAEQPPGPMRLAAHSDGVDWEAVRTASVDEIAHVIKERGMQMMLAARIKAFLEKVKAEHGRIDLEWLRERPASFAREYLNSLHGLGAKSSECIMLLCLHHPAFPVDTNVGRICVRLGWVPLEPLDEELQLHLLDQYPIQQRLQEYLWRRLRHLEQRELYQLHYQLITFGKVFCTKRQPNCLACPMQDECKHYESAKAHKPLSVALPHSYTTSNPVVSVAAPPQVSSSTLGRKPVSTPQGSARKRGTKAPFFGTGHSGLENGSMYGESRGEAVGWLGAIRSTAGLGPRAWYTEIGVPGQYPLMSKQRSQRVRAWLRQQRTAAWDPQRLPQGGPQFPENSRTFPMPTVAGRATYTLLTGEAHRHHLVDVAENALREARKATARVSSRTTEPATPPLQWKVTPRSIEWTTAADISGHMGAPPECDQAAPWHSIPRHLLESFFSALTLARTQASGFLVPQPATNFAHSSRTWFPFAGVPGTEKACFATPRNAPYLWSPPLLSPPNYAQSPSARPTLSARSAESLLLGLPLTSSSASLGHSPPAYPEMTSAIAAVSHWHPHFLGLNSSATGLPDLNIPLPCDDEETAQGLRESVQGAASDARKRGVGRKTHAPTVFWALPLKRPEKLRTVRHAVKLPDDHPLLGQFDRREEADPCPYFAILWPTTVVLTSDSAGGSNCSSARFASVDALPNAAEAVPTAAINTHKAGEVAEPVLLHTEWFASGDAPNGGSAFPAAFMNETVLADVGEGVVSGAPTTTAQAEAPGQSLVGAKGAGECLGWETTRCAGVTSACRGPRPLVRKARSTRVRVAPGASWRPLEKTEPVDGANGATRLFSIESLEQRVVETKRSFETGLVIRTRNQKRRRESATFGVPGGVQWRAKATRQTPIEELVIQTRLQKRRVEERAGERGVMLERVWAYVPHRQRTKVARPANRPLAKSRWGRGRDHLRTSEESGLGVVDYYAHQTRRSRRKSKLLPAARAFWTERGRCANTERGFVEVIDLTGEPSEDGATATQHSCVQKQASRSMSPVGSLAVALEELATGNERDAWAGDPLSPPSSSALRAPTSVFSSQTDSAPPSTPKTPFRQPTVPPHEMAVCAMFPTSDAPASRLFCPLAGKLVQNPAPCSSPPKPAPSEAPVAGSTPPCGIVPSIVPWPATPEKGRPPRPQLPPSLEESEEAAPVGGAQESSKDGATRGASRVRAVAKDSPCRCCTCCCGEEGTAFVTVLIPSRTAMRGRFPLNGTYFQTNELFADHATSKGPLSVPAAEFAGLPRSTVMFGTGAGNMFKGCSREDVTEVFQNGYVCVRGFDLDMRKPRQLSSRLHVGTSTKRVRPPG